MHGHDTNFIMWRKNSQFETLAYFCRLAALVQLTLWLRLQKVSRNDTIIGQHAHILISVFRRDRVSVEDGEIVNGASSETLAGPFDYSWDRLSIETKAIRIMNVFQILALIQILIMWTLILLMPQQLWRPAPSPDLTLRRRAASEMPGFGCQGQQRRGSATLTDMTTSTSLRSQFTHADWIGKGEIPMVEYQVGVDLTQQMELKVDKSLKHRI